MGGRTHGLSEILLHASYRIALGMQVSWHSTVLKATRHVLGWLVHKWLHRIIRAAGLQAGALIVKFAGQLSTCSCLCAVYVRVYNVCLGAILTSTS